jgi:hypothetical protein
MVTDVDRLLTQDMEDNRGKLLARTALRVVIRTIAAQRAKKKMSGENPLLNLLVNVGTDIATSQLEQADTRLCFMLPKTIHISRVPVPPGTYTAKASALAAGGRRLAGKSWDTITVGKGEKRFLFFPCLR